MTPLRSNFDGDGLCAGATTSADAAAAAFGALLLSLLLVLRLFSCLSSKPMPLSFALISPSSRPNSISLQK